MSTSPPPSGKDPPSPTPQAVQAPPSSSNTSPTPAAPEVRPHSQQESYGQPASQLSPNSSNLPPPRPDFAPFFTLISDSSSNTVHHPVNVHYIFSDDDAGALTAACMHTLSSPLASISDSSSSPLSSAQRASKTDVSASESSGSSAPRRDKRGEQAREERFIVLDVNEAGDKVVAAHSLTPNWQLVGTEIMKAPTWDGAEEEEVGSLGQGLMLKIEGTDGRFDDGGADTDAEVQLQALVESFDAKMMMLKRVVAAGGEREGDEAGN